MMIWIIVALIVVGGFTIESDIFWKIVGIVALIGVILFIYLLDTASKATPTTSNYRPCEAQYAPACHAIGR